MQFSVLAFLYFLTSICSVVLTLYMRKRIRSVVSYTPLLYTMITIIFVSFFSGLEMIFIDIEIKFLMAKLFYIPFMMHIPCLILFVTSQTERHGKLNRYVTYTSLFGSIAFVVVAIINPFNLFHASYTSTVSLGMVLFDATYGPVFWIFVIFSYFTICYCTIFLIYKFIKQKRSRVELALLLLTFWFPLFCNVLYIVRILPFDLTDRKSTRLNSSHT